MPQQRGYRDACGIAHSLELIGERWALLVVRELLFGPKRFTDLRRDLPTASPNALAARLRELAAIGVICRRRLPAPAAAWVYELTPWGRELEPILVSLGSWAIRSGRHHGTGHLSATSAMLTIRTFFHAADTAGTLEVCLGDDRFGVRLDAGHAEVSSEPSARPEAVITTNPASLDAAFGDKRSLDESIADGTIVITGNRRLAARLIIGVKVPDPPPVG